jgi:hypothetical protein
VDDILRTGSTLSHFVSRTGGLGLAIGLYYKLPYVLGDSVSIYEQHQNSELIMLEPGISLIKMENY